MSSTKKPWKKPQLTRFDPQSSDALKKALEERTCFADWDAVTALLAYKK